MKACLAVVSLVLFTASCGVLRAPDGWPVIFPGWEDDPALESQPGSPEVVVDSSAASAGAAVESESSADTAPVLTPAGAPTAGDEPAAANPESQTSEPTEPAPELPSDPPPDPLLSGPADPPPDQPADAPPASTEAPPPVLTSAQVLDAPIAAEPNAGMRVRDLLVTREDGVVRMVLVVDAQGLEHVLPPSALAWTAADGPRLVLPFAAVDARELFAAEDPIELSGVVTALEEAGAASALKVRDEGNLLHRVAVPAAELLERALPALAVGATVHLRAAPSRDDDGKVWIPAVLTVGEETLELRNEQGAELWSGLSRGLQSARGLIGASIPLADAEWTGSDWTFDPAAMQMVSIDVVGADTQQTAPWSALPASLDR